MIKYSAMQWMGGNNRLLLKRLYENGTESATFYLKSLWAKFLAAFVQAAAAFAAWVSPYDVLLATALAKQENILGTDEHKSCCEIFL
eukprot:scaffold17430_cov45-Prasinocladus_malaysianus.AAC.1